MKSCALCCTRARTCWPRNFRLCAYSKSIRKVTNGDAHVDLNEGGVQVLVIRRELTVTVEPLAAGEAGLLTALAEKQTLGDAVQAALTAQPDFDLTATLADHLRRGTLVDCITE